MAPRRVRVIVEGTPRAPNVASTDLGVLRTLHGVQAEFFDVPHPLRSTCGIAGLPHDRIELTAVVKRR